MPKLLNLKKLEEKFQALSRSRESIQGLALWIMQHKEVYINIVEQWLIGISKDCNTLAMFYVANEIIQGCGKKKCPEFREAFSKVLEEAVSFDHVKEFKDKILRLLSLWKERNLFDNELYQSIENKLNDSDGLESSDEELEEEEEELSEMDIIQQFKKEILIDRIKELKPIESKRKEKEDILNYADVPELPNLESISVRTDCKEAIKKCDAYMKLVENYTKLMNKEISMRKKILRELNKNCVFYTAQQKDVNQVANAFRVYGKRVKLLETKLGEKMTTFSSPSYSPCFSESNASTNTGFSHEDDTSKNFLLSPSNWSNQSFLSSPSNDSFTFSGKVSSKLATEIFGDIKQPEKCTKDIKVSESVSLKETQAIEKELTPSKTHPKVKEHAVDNLSAHSETPLEKEYASFLQCLKTKESPQSQPSPHDKSTFSEKLSAKTIGKEIVSPVSEYVPEGLLSESNSSLHAQSEDLKGNLDSSNKKFETQDNADVDLLLEESFDNKAQTKLNFKRKIELLLKSKAKKQCTEQQSQEGLDKEVEGKVQQLQNLKENKVLKDETKKEDAFNKSNTSKISSSITEKNISNHKDVKNTKEKVNSEIEVFTKVKTPEVDIGSRKRLIKTVSGKTNVPVESTVASTDQTETMPFNTNATFTGTAASTFISNKLSNTPLKDTKESENETLMFNPTATFTGMDMSSILSSFSSKDKKDSNTISSDHSKETPMTSFLPKLPTNLSTGGLEQPENFSSDAPAIALSSPIVDSPEIKKQAETGTSPKVPALSSFKFDLSTDLLKNILRINEQNSVTDSNAKSENTEATKQNESNSGNEGIIRLLGEFQYDDSSAEDSCDSNLVSKGDSKDCLQNVEATPEKLEKISVNSSSNTSEEMESEPSDNVSKSGENDLVLVSSLGSVKRSQDISSSEEKLSVNSDNLNSCKTEILDTKPSLLKTLKNVLVCLSENMQSKSNSKISIEKPFEMETPLPIENMLKIYNYVHGCHDDCFWDNSVPDISSKTFNNNQVQPLVVSVENNYEVMDMECDSEEEAA